MNETAPVGPVSVGISVVLVGPLSGFGAAKDIRRGNSIVPYLELLELVALLRARETDLPTIAGTEYTQVNLSRKRLPGIRSRNATCSRMYYEVSPCTSMAWVSSFYACHDRVMVGFVSFHNLGPL